MTVEEIIRTLSLSPHPEGGWFREMFRDDAGDGRAYSTAIYFLLDKSERSHWHRVDAAEVWHWYAGGPLQLSISVDGHERIHTLGTDLRTGQRPQAVVPAQAWQSAQSLGEWTLVGCTVAPGFEFNGFELAAPGWSPQDGVS